jgi:exodeoxyribonuclease V gamma subunit
MKLRPQLHLHRSNRTEELVEALARVVERPLADPLAAECIVVQGKGMERWLAMQLARRLGVWANPDFPFPRRFMQSAFEAVLGAENGTSAAFEPETMLWSIAELLRRPEPQAPFAEIRRYLADDRGERKRLQLAERVARVFDEYVVYRPEMLLEWQSGAGADWQAILWRELIRRHGQRHLAQVAGELVAAIRQGRAAQASLPERVSVFGISTLAPLYVRLLYALAECIDVHLFLLSPSPEFWATLRSPREMQRELSRHGGGEEERYLEEGHPLLASLGRLGRDFLDLLVSAGDYHEDAADLYVAPGTDSLLQALQSDILHLHSRGARDAGAPQPCGERLEPLLVRADDASLRVHSCHGPMREVEVLHDQLLDLFERSPSLEPRHVVVMAPSISAYAPFIEAVFGARSQPRIPYRIADRRARSTAAAVDAFLTLLEVVRGRLAASAVLDLLAFEPVRSRFGIAEAELEQVRRWIGQAGVRWAADGRHRRLEGQPALDANTWRFGLQRLLLGYAMIGDERCVYRGVLPYDDVEGGEAALLGRLAELCEALFAARQRTEEPRAVEEWRDTLGWLLETTIARDEATVHEHQEIRNALASLAERAAEAAYTGRIDMATMASQLEAELESRTSARGFLGGGVTFCELVPMRSIPSCVVCLLGMNDADFPRLRRRPGFDRMADAPRPGDRSSRDDDRYLFLEALLSARQHLVLTYVGQSINDNSEIPPSVVVSELLDCIDRSFRLADGSPARSHVVVRHPLQPFSPDYFGRRQDERLFSYVQGYHAGARMLESERRPVPPFVAGRLACDVAGDLGVDLEDLARFFANPARAFLQHRLGIYLGVDTVAIEDREPIELDNLERWNVGDRLLRRCLRGESLEQIRLFVRASGVLPPGAPGDLTYDELAAGVESVLARAREIMAGAEPESVEVDLPDSPRLAGVVRDVHHGRLVRAQYSQLAPKHELDLWIRHLALNAAGLASASTLVARDATVRFHPAADSQALLADLVALYRLGLAAPLPFFPRASRAYAEAMAEGRPAAEALRRALRAFTEAPGGGSGGESADAYVRQLYRQGNPLDPGFLAGAGEVPSFGDVAARVCRPLLAHREALP